MRIEQAPDRPFQPITITIESREERGALWFLGCSGHLNVQQFSSITYPSLYGTTEKILKEVLDKLAAALVEI